MCTILRFVLTVAITWELSNFNNNRSESSPLHQPEKFCRAPGINLSNQIPIQWLAQQSWHARVGKRRNVITFKCQRLCLICAACELPPGFSTLKGDTDLKPTVKDPLIYQAGKYSLMTINEVTHRNADTSRCFGCVAHWSLGHDF